MSNWFRYFNNFLRKAFSTKFMMCILLRLIIPEPHFYWKGFSNFYSRDGFSVFSLTVLDDTLTEKEKLHQQNYLAFLLLTESFLKMFWKSNIVCCSVLTKMIARIVDLAFLQSQGITLINCSIKSRKAFLYFFWVWFKKICNVKTSFIVKALEFYAKLVFCFCCI